MRRRAALSALLTSLALAAAVAAGAQECLECHGVRGFAVPGRPLWLRAEAHAAGAHGDLTCTDCHKGQEEYPHPGPHRVRCDLPCHAAGATHEAIVRGEASGAHARLADPPCLGCHGVERAARGPEVSGLCLSCHGDVDGGGRRFGDTPGSFGYWAHRRISAGKRAPSCPDCHGFHAVKSGKAARSACSATGCHPETGEVYGALFDHRGDPTRPPWGGAVAAAAVVGGIFAAALFIHSLRR